MIPAKYPPKIIYLFKSRDAVAEVVDFITILGILLLSFSIIGLAGYPILRNTQETRYIENTRQSFVVAAENINKIALGQAPSQSMELKMYGGTLRVTGSSTINITAKNSTQTIILEPTKLMRSIENSVGGTIVAYEGTGIWVKYPDGTVLNAYKPLITNHSNTLVIPVVYVNGDSSIGGNGMNRVTACPDKPCSPTINFYSNVSNITITITGNYTSGWRDYFNDTMNWDVNLSHDTLTGSLNATNLDVYILESRIYTVIT